MTGKTDILVALATEVEAAPLKARLSGVEKEGAVTFATLGDLSVTIVVTGPGPLNTAAALSRVLPDLEPKLVIQAGCAGAMPGSGLSCGDLAVATEIVDMQMGIEAAIAKDVIDDPPFHVLETRSAKIKNRYPVDIKLLDAAVSALVTNGDVRKIGVAKGPIGTTSTITSTKNRAKLLERRFGVIAEAMEGAATAHVCLLLDVPFLEIRAISNMAGDRSQEGWDIDAASENSALSICACAGKLLSETKGNRL